MALGDSLSAGYGAHPATQGFVYQLYQSGVIDNVNHTLFCNAGVPNATSADVLAYQVPQVGLFFSNTGTPYRQVITLTVGGNDLVADSRGGRSDRGAAHARRQSLRHPGRALATSFPSARIYVANQYDPRLRVPNEAS